ncbi:FmdB family zinc ribbon protein [Streptomyces spirodelae]|uniref:FmdB family transcriptional regulator n=1 Tax=Streptomyces spirodelae TaxID=2812904 RepID=A0ABS3WZ59_9ACTN|nr:FmdB family zinc ribbon protein [Streptomyces spirodelae]MBO8188420.1 FmdB family transcriptional regulator [Streptomyces spirodelae]
MPTYQYQCTECGEGLEVVQKFTDNSLTECPNCQGHLKKVFSAVGIVFKGSGFYRNDSRSSSSSSSPASGSSSSDSSAKNGDSKSSSSTSGSSSSSSSSESKSSGKSDSKSTAKAATSA